MNTSRQLDASTGTDSPEPIEKIDARARYEIEETKARIRAYKPKNVAQLSAAFDDKDLPEISGRLC